MTSQANTQPDEIEALYIESSAMGLVAFRQAMATMIQIATTETLEWALDNSDDITNAIKDRIAEPSDPTEGGEK